MDKSTPFEILNGVLAIMSNYGVKIGAMELAEELDKNDQFRDYGIYFFDEVMNKLISDGYVRKEVADPTNELSANTKYVITFDGIYFESDGGYVKRAERQTIDENEAYIRTLILTYGTALAGVGGIGLLLIEAYKLFW